MPAFPATPAFGPESPAIQLTEGAAQSFKLGAAVVLDASKLVTECGADPALIYGFAGHPATKGLPATVDIVFKAWEGQKFWMAGSSAFVYADNGKQYGITKDANGIWIVDRAKTGASERIYIHYVDLERQLALVTVIAANRQVAP